MIKTTSAHDFLCMHYFSILLIVLINAVLFGELSLGIIMGNLKVLMWLVMIVLNII